MLKLATCGFQHQQRACVHPRQDTVDQMGGQATKRHSRCGRRRKLCSFCARAVTKAKGPATTDNDQKEPQVRHFCQEGKQKSRARHTQTFVALPSDPGHLSPKMGAILMLLKQLRRRQTEDTRKTKCWKCIIMTSDNTPNTERPCSDAILVRLLFLV